MKCVDLRREPDSIQTTGRRPFRKEKGTGRIQLIGKVIFGKSAQAKRKICVNFDENNCKSLWNS